MIRVSRSLESTCQALLGIGMKLTTKSHFDENSRVYIKHIVEMAFKLTAEKSKA